MVRRLSNIFKTTHVTKLTKFILESSYWILQVTSKWKTLKMPLLFFKGRWILDYYWHSNWHNFGYNLGKVAKLHFPDSPQRFLKARHHSYQQKHPLQNNGLWKKKKFFVVFLADLFLKWKLLTFWIFNKSNIWAKGLSYVKNWGTEVNCAWNYGPSKLLLHFTKYGLYQLKNKHMKTAIN